MYEVDRVLIAKNKSKEKKLFSKVWNNLKKSTFYKLLSKKSIISKFSGWGLEVNHSDPPWKVEQKESDKFFLETNSKLLNLINEKKFRLTQFEYHDTDYKKILNELKWRHYLIYNSVLELSNNTKENKKTLVECGVCDGLTFFFAASALQFKQTVFNGFLYDSWSKFSYNDKKDIFDYSFLSIEIAKKNLQSFKNELVFNEGNIPEIFNKASNPEKIDFLHIDLNSDDATLKSLEFFYEKILPGGIIIFDDYGRIQSEKKVIDKFLNNKKGYFVSLPTGQAVFVKK